MPNGTENINIAWQEGVKTAHFWPQTVQFSSIQWLYQKNRVEYTLWVPDNFDEGDSSSLVQKVRDYQEGLHWSSSMLPPLSSVQTPSGSVLSCASTAASVIPGNSASQLSSLASQRLPAKKWQSGLYTPSPMAKPNAPRPATDHEVSIFEDLLTTLFASANISFNAVENPEFQDLFNTCLPGLKLPSRKTLFTCVLNTKMVTMRHNVKMNSKDHLATLQCDGWTGRNSQHLVAFMITTLGGTELDYQVCKLSHYICYYLNIVLAIYGQGIRYNYWTKDHW